MRSNLKKYRETGSMDVKPRSGRPRAMSPADEKNLVVRCKRSPHKPATHLRHDIKSATGKAASISVIKRCLADNNLSAYRVRKVPLLSPRLGRSLARIIFNGKRINGVRFCGQTRVVIVCFAPMERATSDDRKRWRCIRGTPDQQ